MGRAPNTKAWFDGYPRKLPAFMLRKDADEVVQGIFGTAFFGRYRVPARDMQTCYRVVFDGAAVARRFLIESRASLGIGVGPGGAGVTLNVRPPRGAQERHFYLPPIRRAAVHDRMAAHPLWTIASHRLRSTGLGDCLWIQDSSTRDCAPLLDDVPYSINAPMLAR